MILARGRAVPFAKSGWPQLKGVAGQQEVSSYRQFGAKIKVGRILKLNLN